MYNKLLISAGGGIISRDQQAEQNEAATIAIGLGGTGVSCLRALKKEVYNRLKPDDSDALVPTYRHIKFLAVDTDRSSLSENGSVDSIDSNTEFLDLSCADIASLLAGAATLKNRPSLQWLKASATQPDGTGISIQNAKAGAGGVRQIGRLLLYQNSSLLVQKLTNMITEARRELSAAAELNIHIFTGIGGGTGAGTFLDVCYIVQHVLGTLGLQGSAQTCGYFFMPDVNIDRVPTADIQEYIKSNGFASMTELNYCMNFDMNGGEWNQIYDGFTIKTTQPPVSLAHLITASNADGVITDNAYDYAMHVAVDYAMDFLVKPDTSENNNNNPFTIQSHISNVRSKIAMTEKRHGACHDYCILGASCAYMPYKEITTYLASKIFEGFGRIDRQLPSENEIDLFVKNTGLSYEEISRALNSKVPAVPMYAVDTKTIYEQTEGLTPDTIPQVLGQMRDSIAKINGVVVENKKKMLENLESSNVDNISSIASMITRVKNKLMEISGQSDKGPYYASAILHNVNAVDLQNKIDGCIARNSENLSMARADMTLRDQTMANTLRALQNSNAFNRKKRGEEYVASVNSYFKQSAKIDFLSMLNDVLVEFKKQVNDLYIKHFAIFDTVMHNLEATFESNRTALSNPIAADNGYAVKLITIQDLQESLDASVRAMRIDDLISGFVNYMLSNPEIWIAQDENKIAHAVSTFFLAELNEFTGRTMLDYLKIKYQTDDPQIIADKVYNDIVMPMYDRAKPLFWLDGSKYTIPADSELGFCTIPKISDEIKGAANKFKISHQTITPRPSFCDDRISFLVFNCGIPMYGYKGVDNYRAAKPVVGAHLYEGAVGDSRDWRRLYDITPFSCINETEERYKTYKVRNDLVQKAKQLGIYVRRDLGATFDYVIKEFDETKIEEMLKEIETAKASDNTEKAKAVLQAITAEELPVRNQRTVKNIGAMYSEDLVADDIIIESDVLLALITAQVNLLQKREDALKALESHITGAGIEMQNIQVFANALCTGVIKKENEYTYSYVKVTYGISESVELTTIDTAPYGEHLPLYSAFKGFEALDKETMDSISADIKDKKVNHHDEIATTSAEAATLISPDKINAMVQRAQKSYAANAKDIVKFLQDLSFEINNF